MKIFTKQNLLPKNGEVYLHQPVLPEDDCAVLLNTLIHSLAWKQERIQIFGKWLLQPRLSAWHGDRDKNYTYSGITLEPEPWTAPLLKLKSTAENITNTNFNSCLVNYYRNGQDSMGWHRDNEKELGKNPVIGSFSLGATRQFKMLHTKDKNLKVNIKLKSGSYLEMRDETQHYWKHCIPKEKSCKQARINLTFRAVL